MTTYPYSFFNKSPQQLRRLGARGGKIHGHNQRARHAPQPPQVPLRSVPQKTAAEAGARLNAQFP